VAVYKYLIELLQSVSQEQKKIFSYITKKSRQAHWYFIQENYLEKTEIDFEEFEKILLDQISLHLPIAKKREKKEFSHSKNIQDIYGQFANFEERENQKKMIDIVKESLDTGKKIAIEAPTGLGKTLAYLLPSVLFSLSQKEQVYISTSTKALQDQIYFKDLPLLQKQL